MTTLALIIAFAAPCPTVAPSDGAPVILPALCPAPGTGLLYPVTHDAEDAFTAMALRNAAAELRTMADIAREHAGEPHPLLYVGAGLVLGIGATWLAFTTGAP